MASPPRAIRRVSEGSPLTPLTQHYYDVADQREQPSIKRFRQNCSFFPHPIELLGANGLAVPRHVNFATFLRSQHVLRWMLAHVDRMLPRPDGYVVHHVVGGPECIPLGLEFDFSEDAIVVGVLMLPTHAMFYEARTGGGSCDVRLFDPNGTVRMNSYGADLADVFAGCRIIENDVTTVNFGEYADERMAHSSNGLDRLRQRVIGQFKTRLRRLGFDKRSQDDGPTWHVHGYCATNSTFFYIDYVCTEQYRRPTVTSSHFFRAAREWVTPDSDESETGATHWAVMRTAVLGRYVAHKLFEVVLGSLDAAERAQTRTTLGLTDEADETLTLRESVRRTADRAVVAYESTLPDGSVRREEFEDLVVPLRSTRRLGIVGSGASFQLP